MVLPFTRKQNHKFSCKEHKNNERVAAGSLPNNHLPIPGLPVCVCTLIQDQNRKIWCGNNKLTLEKRRIRSIIRTKGLQQAGRARICDKGRNLWLTFMQIASMICSHYPARRTVHLSLLGFLLVKISAALSMHRRAKRYYKTDGTTEY